MSHHFLIIEVLKYKMAITGKEKNKILLSLQKCGEFLEAMKN